MRIPFSETENFSTQIFCTSLATTVATVAAIAGAVVAVVDDDDDDEEGAAFAARPDRQHQQRPLAPHGSTHSHILCCPKDL